MLCLQCTSQIDCDHLCYNGYFWTNNDTAGYQGVCSSYNKKHRLLFSSYFNHGFLDSIVDFYKSGSIAYVEQYANEMHNGVSKYFYKNGVLKQIINFKNDSFFGLWREYYKNGKIKYEAEYENNQVKDGSYYRWTKEGVKYLYEDVEVERTKKIGKAVMHAGYGKRRKTRVN